VVRVECLNQDAAGEVAAAGAPRHLSDELEGSFGRAEVGHGEAGVHRDDADQRHVREVVTLGDHLRADDNVKLLSRETVQEIRQAAAASNRISVHAADSGFGEEGGNLAFNDPHSDPGTVLLIHNASVTLGNGKADRRIALNEFFVDMYATVLELGDLLVEIQIPALPAGMSSTYLRLHRYQRPTLGVAVGARVSNGTIEEARLAVGCVGPKAQRLSELERKIEGTNLSDAKRVLTGGKNYLRELLRPVEDLLGSTEYKLYMTGVMLSDALEQAAQNGNTRH